MPVGSFRHSAQAPSSIVMIRPHRFSPNAQTASDNAFQADPIGDPVMVAKNAYAEVTGASDILNRYGIRTHVFEDETVDTPDAVFPNNWFSTHVGGHVANYPMYASNRRRERRADVIDMLKSNYRVQDVIDYSGLEHDGLYLEGTGAMVLDHIDRVAYAVQSNRTDPVALERFCTHFNYEPMVFEARDRNAKAIYHTNVLMCIATNFVLICLDMIDDDMRKQQIIERLEASGKDVIALSEDQIGNFAGNAIELQGSQGRILALSKRAFSALTKAQIKTIEASAIPVPINVPTIELAGGSVRCMMAGIHLAAR